MTLFLTSSPCVYLAPRAILNPENQLIANLERILPPRPKCLFICSDPDDPGFTDRVSKEMAAAFEEAGIPFSGLSILDRRNQEEAEILIWNSDLILLAGGHVPTQNAFFNEIGLAEIIANYQGVVIGISAGTMNCADPVYAQPEEKGESSPDFPRFLPGLGLTKVQILPHYQQVKDYTLDGLRLFEDITYADSFGQQFYVFPDGTYLLKEKGRETIFGEFYLLRDGQMESMAATGDITPLP